MSMETITQQQIETFESIRQSGKTNMFDINRVISLSDGVLTRKSCIIIMNNYDALIAKFNIQRD